MNVKCIHLSVVLDCLGVPEIPLHRNSGNVGRCTDLPNINGLWTLYHGVQKNHTPHRDLLVVSQSHLHASEIYARQVMRQLIY